MARIEVEKLWRWLTLLCGSAALIVWVIFRFSTKSVNFDLVGQQLLSRQWLEGNFEGSLIGPTNYIVKMMFLYMPSEILGMDPKVFLVGSTMAINTATFIGLYFVLRKILRHFSVEPGVVFSISMLWLATVAGSVFWVQFTNSRNIELLAGLTLLYIGLLLYEKMSLRNAALFIGLAGVTYFSDPLQLFVTSSILLVYVFASSILLEKTKYREVLLIVALVVSGYLLSRLMAALVQYATGVEFIATDSLSQSAAVINDIPLVALETMKNTLRLIAGTNEMGAWRQMMNIAFVGFLSFFSVVSLLKNKKYRQHQNLVLFITSMIAVPVAVYIASGQPAFKTDTSRYLIVLAPALVMLFSVIDIKSLTVRTRQVLIAIALLCIVASMVSLLWATIQFRGNVLDTKHLESRYSYLEKGNYSYGYASMDTAIPAMYFLGRGRSEVLLPLSCDGDILRKATLFFDKNIFMKHEKSARLVPIILDGDAISNYPNSCTVESIRKQIGDPAIVDLRGADTVMLYGSDQLEALAF